MNKETSAQLQHVAAGFVLASMYFVYMFVLLPNI